MYLLNLKKRNHLVDLVVDGRKLLKFILKKQGVMMWTAFSWLMIYSYLANTAMGLKVLKQDGEFLK
jgi:hypothetical protein